jgi:hypothetical protein
MRFLPEAAAPAKVMKSVHREGSFCFKRLPAQEFFHYNIILEKFMLAGNFR